MKYVVRKNKHIKPNKYMSVIIEFITIGNSVKVTAIDSATLTEVSIVGSPKLSQKELSDAAIRKLNYVLKKNKN